MLAFHKQIIRENLTNIQISQKVIESLLMYFNKTVSTLLNYWDYSNRIVMLCNKVSFWELLDCFDNDLGNSFENNAWTLEHNVEELQEILIRIM